MGSPPTPGVGGHHPLKIDPKRKNKYVQFSFSLNQGSRKLKQSPVGFLPLNPRKNHHPELFPLTKGPNKNKHKQHKFLQSRSSEIPRKQSLL